MTVLLPAAVADANWFLVATVVPVGATTLLVHPSWGLYGRGPAQALVHRRHLRGAVLWTLVFAAALLFVVGVALEVYHSRGCPNSDIFHYEVESLARTVLQFCARQRVPFWVAFGNLLFVLRGQKRIPVGDTDSDVSIPKRAFLERFQSIEGFSSAVWEHAVVEMQRPVYVSYLPDRELVQVFLTPELTGSHADIWLYTEETDYTTGETWLVNNDRTVRGKRFPIDQVFPLVEASTLFLNEPVTLPQNATYLAIAEYGRSFMTPMTTRLECIENVLNGYTFFKRKPLLLVNVVSALLSALGLSVLAVSALPHLRRALLVASPRRKSTRAKDVV